jgi:hypothetical protein
MFLADRSELGGNFGLRATDDLAAQALAIRAAPEVELADPPAAVRLTVDAAVASAATTHCRRPERPVAGWWIIGACLPARGGRLVPPVPWRLRVGDSAAPQMVLPQPAP